MKIRVLAVALLVGSVFGMTALRAGDDCLETGDRLGAFTVTKIAGAEDDGVEVGENLCYRCKFSSRPMVLVFARSGSESVGKLTQQLDELMQKHEDAQLKALVSMLGENEEATKEAAEKFAKTYAPKHVAVAIPSDLENGPKSYKIDSEADVTIVVGTDGQVVKNMSFAADEIDIDAVVEGVNGMIQG